MRSRSSAPSKTAKSASKKAKRKFSWKRFGIVMFFTVALGIFVAMGAYIYIIIQGDRLLKQNIAKLDVPEATIIYDKDGKEVSRLARENRDVVKIGDMHKLLPKAFVAVEDERFYEHAGVDPFAIGRAIVTDIIHGSFVQGGSTITQQLAKNLFLQADKTFLRKATEASIALALESNYTKPEILEMYMNTIFFGHRAYGVKSAAQVYFGVDDLKQLELWQIATLAGIPKAPSTLNPITDPVRSKERRQIVLKLMYDQGMISKTQMEEAAAEDYKGPSNASAGDLSNQAFIDYVLSEVKEKTGISEEELLVGGYHIYTTMEPKAQNIVESTLNNAEWYPENGPEQKVQSGMVIMDHQTGGIVAMYGGRDYVPRGLNRATVKQQPGSSFKPLVVYAPALETGKWSPYSKLIDERMDFNGYKPRNYNGKYRGEVTMVDAIRDSINVPAVWLLQQMGIKKGLRYAESVGVKLEDEDRNLAVALGGLSVGASPLEMAQAYTPFANQGEWVEAYSVSKVEDSEQATIYEHAAVSNQVLSAQNAWYMTQMLREVVTGGTGKNARMKRPSAGKTGSTQVAIKGVSGNDDVWFVGYTPEWTAAIWMGFDKTDAKHYLKTSSGTPAKLFAEIMSRALEGRKIVSFEKSGNAKDMKQPPKAVQDMAAAYEEVENAVYLSWSEAGEDVSYRLYKKAADEEEFQLFQTTAEVLVKDMTVEPGKSYQYYVTVLDTRNNQESEPSNTATVEIPEVLEEPEPTDPILDPDAGEGGEDPGAEQPADPGETPVNETPTEETPDDTDPGNGGENPGNSGGEEEPVPTDTNSNTNG